MNDDFAKREAQVQWEMWHKLQDQIKDLETLVVKGDELMKQHEARLSELRREEDAAHERFERMLKRLQE